MRRFRSETHREHAKALRRNMTDAERVMWYRLRAHRFDGWSFRRQAPIGRFIVDFLCPKKRLVVEIDGGAHDALADRERDRDLAALGYRVIRFSNLDVLTNLETVLAALRSELAREAAE